jgi:CheY-like chemotaxis protein
MTLTSTILIVDDELGGRKTLEGILRPFGYDLVFASNGVEALTQTSDELLMILRWHWPLPLLISGTWR